MENIGFLVGAYTVFWVLIFLFMFSISRRQKNLEAEIARLKDMRSEE